MIFVGLYVDHLYYFVHFFGACAITQPRSMAYAFLSLLLLI